MRTYKEALGQEPKASQLDISTASTGSLEDGPRLWEFRAKASSNSLMTSVPSRVGRQVDTGEKWTEATIPFPKAGVPREQMFQAQPRYDLEEVGVKLS